MPVPVAQPDLFDWKPPEPVARFDAHAVRAADLKAVISRAVAATLRDTELPRDVIARRMSVYLGERISRYALDAYASQGRTDRPISVPRFCALIHVTGDRRLLQVVADLFGWVAVESSCLTMIELAAITRQRQLLARQARVLSAKASREVRRAC